MRTTRWFETARRRRRGLLAETDPLLQRWQRFAAAINQPHLPAGGVVENAATPESLLCRCEDVRCGDVAAADDWLQAKLTQRPAGGHAAAAERAAVPSPARKRLLPPPG
ncbi:hypothetical protein MJ584_04010 [Klebsiella pneumoniae]|nr:hypothetical protein MJ584_04010 [Klebsiella pneumoniae]